MCEQRLEVVRHARVKIAVRAPPERWSLVLFRPPRLPRPRQHAWNHQLPSTLQRHGVVDLADWLNLWPSRWAFLSKIQLLDSTNSESSETVSSTKSSTTSSSIPLMTISMTHAKDKFSLSSNGVHTQLFLLRMSVCLRTRKGPRCPLLDLRANDADPTVLSVARLSSSAELAPACRGGRARARGRGQAIRFTLDETKYTCLAEARLHSNVAPSSASPRTDLGTASSHSSAFSSCTSRAGRRRPRYQPECVFTLTQLVPKVN
ncbi:hypothetical protein EDB89DRAFT_230772 [Lactarius sanguifluus]|nr:hypothetical protein EDB89DRAFT_230772 [Lactarius sanguifluus]